MDERGAFRKCKGGKDGDRPHVYKKARDSGGGKGDEDTERPMAAAAGKVVRHVKLASYVVWAATKAVETARGGQDGGGGEGGVGDGQGAGLGGGG